MKVKLAQFELRFHEYFRVKQSQYTKCKMLK